MPPHILKDNLNFFSLAYIAAEFTSDSDTTTDIIIFRKYVWLKIVYVVSGVLIHSGEVCIIFSNKYKPVKTCKTIKNLYGYFLAYKIGFVNFFFPISYLQTILINFSVKLIKYVLKLILINFMIKFMACMSFLL